jgi:hypothetical protein
MSVVVEAEFESKCPACGDTIHVGDEIVADVDGEFVHLDCEDG